MTTAREAADAVDRPVNRLGTGVMGAPEVFRAGEAHGVSGWAWYHGGRGGPLGDVGPEVVHAAFVFFPLASVEKGWGKVRAAGADPSELGRAYAGALQDWGRAHLDGVDGLERLAELGLRVVDGADAAGLPLLAAWRALPRPDDAPGRALHALQLLRELRGGLHGLAVLAEGMTPLEALASGPYGAANAQMFGWAEPYPEPDGLQDARARVDERTSLLAGRTFEVLDDRERDELVALVRGVVEHVKAQQS